MKRGDPGQRRIRFHHLGYPLGDHTLLPYLPLLPVFLGYIHFGAGCSQLQQHHFGYCLGDSAYLPYLLFPLLNNTNKTTDVIANIDSSNPNLPAKMSSLDQLRTLYTSPRTGMLSALEPELMHSHLASVFRQLESRAWGSYPSSADALDNHDFIELNTRWSAAKRDPMRTIWDREYAPVVRRWTWYFHTREDYERFHAKFAGKAGYYVRCHFHEDDTTVAYEGREDDNDANDEIPGDAHLICCHDLEEGGGIGREMDSVG